VSGEQAQALDVVRLIGWLTVAGKAGLVIGADSGTPRGSLGSVCPA
jgi:hypothetical protein